MGFDIDQELGPLTGDNRFVGGDVAAQTVRTTKPRKSSDQDSVGVSFLADAVTDYNAWLHNTMRSTAVRFSDNTAGTTVAAFVVDPETGNVHFSSAGDSSIYGVFKNKKGKIVVRQINQLHESPNRDKAGGLAMCSSFGDKDSNVSSRANESGFDDKSWESLEGRHASIASRYLSNDNSTFDMNAYAHDEDLEPLGVMAASDGFDPNKLEGQLNKVKPRGAITPENFTSKMNEMMPKVITKNNLASFDDCGWVVQAMPKRGDRAKVCVVADGHDNAGGGSLSNAVVHYIGECARRPLASGELTRADLIRLLEEGVAVNQLCVIDGLLYRNKSTSIEFSQFVGPCLSAEDRVKSPYEQAAIVQAALEDHGTPQLKAEVRLATLTTGLNSLANIKNIWEKRGIYNEGDAFHRNLFNTIVALRMARDKASEAYRQGGDVEVLQTSIARIEKIKRFIDLYMLVRQDAEAEFLGVTDEVKDSIELNARQITATLMGPHDKQQIDLSAMQAAEFDKHLAMVLNEDVHQFIQAIEKEKPFVSLKKLGVKADFLTRLQAYMQDANGIPLARFQKLRSIMSALKYDPEQDRLTNTQNNLIKGERRRELKTDLQALERELDGYFGELQETVLELSPEGDLHVWLFKTVKAWKGKSAKQNSRAPELLAKLEHIERASSLLEEVSFVGLELSVESKRNIARYFENAIQPFQASRFGNVSPDISRLSAQDFGEKLEKNTSSFVSFVFGEIVRNKKNKLLGENERFHNVRKLRYRGSLTQLSIVQREFASVVRQYPEKAAEIFNEYAPRIDGIAQMDEKELEPALNEIRYALKAEKVAAQLDEIISPVPGTRSVEVSEFKTKIDEFIRNVIHGSTKGEGGAELSLSDDKKVIESVFAYIDDALRLACEENEQAEQFNACEGVIAVASSLMEASDTVRHLQEAFQQHVVKGDVDVDVRGKLPLSPIARGAELNEVGKV